MGRPDDPDGASRFTWPPMFDGAPPIVVDASESAEPPTVDAPAPIPTIPDDRSRLTALIESTEETFLGVQKRSFLHAARAQGWSPSPRDRWCWRCGGATGLYETDGDGCASCKDRRLAWGRFVRIGSYEGPLKDAIRDLKFSRWRRNGTELGRLMGEQIAEDLGRNALRPSEGVIVPVPMSFRRRMSRGVDHTLVLARAASRASGVPVRRALIARHAPSQVGLTVHQRARNIAGSFRLRAGAGLGEMVTVIVLDDIRTTGATLTAACKAVREVGRGRSAGRMPAERVWAAAIAVGKGRREVG